jgi:hypothetical protein
MNSDSRQNIFYRVRSYRADVVKVVSYICQVFYYENLYWLHLILINGMQYYLIIQYMYIQT